jgi:hypothetical protein
MALNFFVGAFRSMDALRSLGAKLNTLAHGNLRASSPFGSLVATGESFAKKVCRGPTSEPWNRVPTQDAKPVHAATERRTRGVDGALEEVLTFPILEPCVQ